MAKRPRPSAFWEQGYLKQTQRPLNCLLFVLVPLAVYHVFAMRYGTQLLAPRDLARVLGYFGATATFLPPLLIVAVLLAQHFAHGYRWQFRPGVLLGMAGESALWVIPVLSLSYLTNRALAAGPDALPPMLARQVLQAIGAGIYEEFIFRLLLIGLALVVLVDVFELRRDVCAAAAIAVGAVLFSLYHIPSSQLAGPAAFPWSAFVFRASAGAYLGGLFVCRGYGIAVGTHIVWNLLVMWMRS